ncbi:MAG: sulfatase, partial [Candidatus Tectomicrobia bacterium]|nr:sulfatase [Candidatus Tectomicrobia bacterium]
RPRLLSPLPAVVVFVLVAGFGYLITKDARPPAGPTLRERGRPAPPGKPNLILIAVDTLRADHVSADARLRGLSPVPVETPAMDRLAGDGTLFLNAISQSSWTKPSFATFLTGLYPSTHGAVHKLHRLPEEVETLAEILSSAGYVTGALANNVNISPTFNFQQGFTDYRYLRPDLPFRAPETGDHLVFYRALRVVNERFLGGGRNPREYYWPAEDVNREAFRWIEANAQRPFFLMIHYMDPHDPYFERPLNGRFYARIRNPNPDPSLAGLYAKAYAQEVRYLDTHIANLLDFLKARGLYDNSLIVLLADHGEEFHEHEGWWHGTSLFEEQVRVPLILKFPKGANAGKAHRGVVELLDVPPTLLEAAGLPRGKRMQGKSLAKLAADGETAAGSPALSELNLEGQVMSSSRADRWKWIRANPGNPRRLPPESLYDITKDPGERENLAGREPALGREMDQKLKGALDAARKGAVPQEKVTLDPATEERLRSLGYIE